MPTDLSSPHVRTIHVKGSHVVLTAPFDVTPHKVVYNAWRRMWRTAVVPGTMNFLAAEIDPTWTDFDTFLSSISQIDRHPDCFILARANLDQPFNVFNLKWI